MNATHKTILDRLNKILIQAPEINAVPILTLMGAQFEADENAAGFGSPELLHALDQIGQGLQVAGTMVSNNLQGAETRRAQAAGEVAAQYPGFNWVYTPIGTANDRLGFILNGLNALAASGNQTPPAPPTPEDAPQ